jgi:hypothetical protein
MSLLPLVDQLQIEVRSALGGGGGACAVAHQRSVTTGWRVVSQVKSCNGTGNAGVPIFSPKVNRY